MCRQGWWKRELQGEIESNEKRFTGCRAVLRDSFMSCQPFVCLKGYHAQAFVSDSSAVMVSMCETLMVVTLWSHFLHEAKNYCVTRVGLGLLRNSLWWIVIVVMCFFGVTILCLKALYQICHYLIFPNKIYCLSKISKN